LACSDDACHSCRGSAEVREVPAAVANGDSESRSDLGVVDPRDGAYFDLVLVLALRRGLRWSVKELVIDGGATRQT